MRKTGFNQNCLQCNKSFYVPGWALRKGRGKYCTMKCYQIAEKGRAAVNLKGLELGHGWNKNKKAVKIIGFKRDEVMNYEGIHLWVTKKLGKPRVCDHCGTKMASKYEWANRSQLYKKEISDWMRLCTLCHRQYDKQFYKEGRLKYV